MHRDMKTEPKGMKTNVQHFNPSSFSLLVDQLFVELHFKMTFFFFNMTLQYLQHMFLHLLNTKNPNKELLKHYKLDIFLFTSRLRPDVLEGRLRGQDRPLAVLLEQALRIKEEVTAGLQSSHGSVQIEALSRKLLENHILTITRIVKQLSMGIQVCKVVEVSCGKCCCVHV